MKIEIKREKPKKGAMARSLVYFCIAVLTLSLVWAISLKTAALFIEEPVSVDVSDVLTFAGNGEPTAHPDFAAIIDDTLALRNLYSPQAKVSVLTNATRINRNDVFEALKKVDNNIVKLDTVNADYIVRVDRPVGNYNLAGLIDCMRAFEGKCVIQTMFMRGTDADGHSVDNTSDEYVEPWIDAVVDIAPREVMIYTIDRETPISNLQKASPDVLDEIVARLQKRGIKASASY